MSQQNQLPLFGFDRLTLGLYLALVAIGWLMIYAVTYNPDAPWAFLEFNNTAANSWALSYFVWCCCSS
jgi:branched-subunit amino acid ABC-type transport system permease component